jgi:hypothetical protein
MIRRLFAAASAISLVLCIATVVLWMRSYRFDQSISSRFKSEQFTIRCVRGHLAVGSIQPADRTVDESVTFWDQRPLLPEEESDLEWAISDEPSGAKSVSECFGCHLTREVVTGDVQRWAEVPARFAAVAFGLMPLIWLAVRLRCRHLSVPGHCRTCGYDLRASTGSCPECGAPKRSEVKG